ncbi:MAG: 2-succinyl-5-enolpyruvyl-6-hydroxy-3-cyclohexene-1-carboxylate synthase, partial [Acidimicrobiaceae bacterium]
MCAELVSARSNEQSKLDDFSWLDLWGTAENSAQRSINTALADEPGLSEPGVARALYGLLPEASNLVVSNSMPIRDVEWFAAPRTGLRVHANRGANGIDGVVSTAVGIALATRQPTTLLIGDIALLHDVNGLISLVSREIDLRIVVID